MRPQPKRLTSFSTPSIMGIKNEKAQQEADAMQVYVKEQFVKEKTLKSVRTFDPYPNCEGDYGALYKFSDGLKIRERYDPKDNTLTYEIFPNAYTNRNKKGDTWYMIQSDASTRRLTDHENTICDNQFGDKLFTITKIDPKDKKADISFSEFGY